METGRPIVNVNPLHISNKSPGDKPAGRRGPGPKILNFLILYIYIKKIIRWRASASEASFVNFIGVNFTAPRYIN